MPRGIYIRTKPTWGKGLTKKIDPRMAKISKTLSETLKHLSRTPTQIESGQRVGLSNKGRSLANTIIEHHNDLCHGAKDPNDVTYMAHSDHSRLHANLQLENGTHPFLAKNREEV